MPRDRRRLGGSHRPNGARARIFRGPKYSLNREPKARGQFAPADFPTPGAAETAAVLPSASLRLNRNRAVAVARFLNAESQRNAEIGFPAGSPVEGSSHGNSAPRCVRCDSAFESSSRVATASFRLRCPGRVTAEFSRGCFSGWVHQACTTPFPQSQTPPDTKARPARARRGSG